MTPNPIVETGEPDIQRALEKFHKHKVRNKKLPVVDAEGKIKGLITVKRHRETSKLPSSRLR